MKKQINNEIRFIIRADKITPLCWDHIRKHFKKIYKQIQEYIEIYGIKKIKFGFNEDLRPICIMFEP